VVWNIFVYFRICLEDIFPTDELTFFKGVETTNKIAGFQGGAPATGIAK
jgi:hypothetical protein